MVMKVIMMMRVTMKIMNKSSYRRVLPIVATKKFYQFFYKNKNSTNSAVDFAASTRSTEVE